MEARPGKQAESSSFLKTDGGKTKSNAIEIPSISLPKGGGAIKGIDETFSVNAVNGTAAFSLPLPFSAARGASPSLSLSYNSGSGNSVFGLGWELSLPTIKREMGKQLPQYDDAGESDTYVFSQAETLVPAFKKDADGHFIQDPSGEYFPDEKDSPDGSETVKVYRPRLEGLFARIERWLSKTTGKIRWRVTTKDNVTTLFGWTSNTVIADPSDERRIAEWLPEFAFDDKGNCIQYLYKKENADGFDPTLLHHRNRLVNGQLAYTNRYPEKVLYGNKTPYKQFGTAYPAEEDYMFQTVFDYGEYNTEPPFTTLKNWDTRTDEFSDYRAGFEIRTTRLCRRVLLFHSFTELPGGSALIKSMDFQYNTSEQEGFTFLRSVTSWGYIKKTDGSYTHKSLPAIEFTYQQPTWNKEVKSIDGEDLVHAPAGLYEPHYQFTDLYNEGLAGILTEQATGWYYKHNLGNGHFQPAKLVSPKPSFTGLGQHLQLADLDADGSKQIVSYSPPVSGYFELDDDNKWQPFKNFRQLPTLDFGDANARMIDLNGDGKSEILITEDHVFTWYESEGRNGFSPGRSTANSFDEEAGPHIVFADSTQTIFLADMSGDGLTDLVRIRNGAIAYWPNLGYGKFGAKVSMDGAPAFDTPDSFNPAYLRLADIDGSGTTDIIYLGKNKFTCWLNLSGNRFSKIPFEIDAFPQIHHQASVTVTDLLGNGVACIIWSSPLTKDAASPLKYVDLMNSTKPHLLVSYKNNLGKEVSLQYTASTQFYLEDKRAGRPWITKLHFPVHCITQTETRDLISGYRFINSYRYHHGCYDHAEREFRGFGLVEQIDSEHFEHWVKGTASNIVDQQLHQQPVVSKTWFHTGAFIRGKKILDQYRTEYWYEERHRQLGDEVVHPEKPLPDARLVAAPGISDQLLEQLSPQEWQEALRACKSMAIRSEVFAQDAPLIGATEAEIRKQLTPYTVSTHNCLIELLQPKGKNKHAIFVVKESEALTYSYERDPEDPRIAHSLTIQFDEYGNVLESASVVYPRLIPDTVLPALTQDAQRELIITYTQNQFTNDVIDENIYRLRLPSEAKTFELKGVSKNDFFLGVKDFEDILSLSEEISYHNIHTKPADGKVQKRLIEHIRTNYYRNGLDGPLPLGQLESLALPYESYQLAYTPTLLVDIYEDRVTPSLMEEGRFTHSEGDDNWWIRSGTTQFLVGQETAANAQSRFYLPLSYTDPYGSTTKAKYNAYFFLIETEDALGNTASVDVFNYRTLSAQRMRDINNNLTEVLTDELGLVKATAVMGKGSEADELVGLTEATEADEIALRDGFFGASDSVALISIGKELLQHATAHFVYDFEVYQKIGKPAVVASIVREEHFQKTADSPIQVSFEYTNGLGQVVMKKVQAEPGVARKVIIQADTTYSLVEEDTALLNPKQLRWIGNGRTVLNNKGNPVKQYEPYFSVTHHYEDLKELVETGVTPVMYYDAMGRLVKTDLPDGTFSKVTFDSWKQTVYDAADTVLQSTWYSSRISGSINEQLLAEGKDPVKEKAAAERAANHANTPTVLHVDTLSRPVLQVENNGKDADGKDALFKTKIELDVEGNLRRVRDARERPDNELEGNPVMQYKYDMLGNPIYQKSMDAGQRWLLVNVLGNPLRTWDERNHEFQYFYDVLHRPTQSKVIGGDGGKALNNIHDRILYGEALPLSLPDKQALNILGKPVEHYDTGGVVRTPEYDFKGQPLHTTRQLFKDYKSVANWTDEALSTDLESDEFTFTTDTDALGRVTRQTAPDGSIITPAYNEAGLLNTETVTHLNPERTTTYIKDIDYNEKGQRTKIRYGNDVTTRFYYDDTTFRLKRLVSRLIDGDPLQDLQYTYDPVGNITHIEDKAIPVVFYANQKIAGVSVYTYDALYRLTEATGRENDAALSFGKQDNWNDQPFRQSMAPGDPLAMRSYTQRYQYDEVGNIMQMRHIAGSNHSWTRDYTYETTSNRLKTTQVGGEVYKYPHHLQHGFISRMPHLEEMDWNFKEELVKTIRQKVAAENGIGEATYYQYDGGGQRIRKLTENSAQAGAIPSRKEERVYIAGYETYRTYEDNTIRFERESLCLMDEGYRFVMIETVKQNFDKNSPAEEVGSRLTRYQLHNHLGSAAFELDETAQVISYEEYHPFGTTAYQANNLKIKAAAKRYRYTGMERDEETGLEYHSARYYLPWLGRWLSGDPNGVNDGLNLFVYTHNQPTALIDQNGKQSTAKPELEVTLQPTLSMLVVPSPQKPVTKPKPKSESLDAVIKREIIDKVQPYVEALDTLLSLSLDIHTPRHENRSDFLVRGSNGGGALVRNVTESEAKNIQRGNDLAREEAIRQQAREILFQLMMGVAGMVQGRQQFQAVLNSKENNLLQSELLQPEPQYVANPGQGVTKSRGGYNNERGLLRETVVAKLIKGQVARTEKGNDLRVGQNKQVPIDVLGPNGEYIMVGGENKASKKEIERTKSRLGELKKAAKDATPPVGFKAVFFTKGDENPEMEDLLKRARKILGNENVIIMHGL